MDTPTTKDHKPKSVRKIATLLTIEGDAATATPPADTSPSRPKIRRASDVFRSDDYRRPRRTYPTGFAELDALTAGGFKSRQLVTVMGPTGGGKTGWSGTFAIHLAEAGTPVVWITTELDDAEQVARWAAIQLRLRRGSTFGADDFLAQNVAAEDGARALEGLPLYVLNLDDPDNCDPWTALYQAIADARDAHAGAAPVVVVDYMQILATEDADRRRLSVTQVATRLRRVARDADVAVVAISSVSRAYYGAAAKARKAKAGEAEDPRDWLAAAKESGDVEYASAVVAYLDTSDKVSPCGESLARLVVAKSRGGQRGFVGLKFHGPSGAFTADPTAAEVMAPAQVDNDRADDERVCEYIRKNPGQVLRLVRHAVKGVGVERAELAVERLLAAGRIEYATEEQTNARGQKRKREVLVVVERVGKDDLDA